MDERDGLKELTEAVGGLQQAIGSITLILKDHGEMLSQLVLMSVEPIGETPLETLIRQLVMQIDQQQGSLNRIERALTTVSGALEQTGTG